MKYYRGKWSFNTSIQHGFGADFIVFIFFVVVNERKKFDHFPEYSKSFTDIYHLCSVCAFIDLFNS